MAYLLHSLTSRRVLRLVVVCVFGMGGVFGTDLQRVSAQTPITGSVVPCKDGRASRYPCKNADLLSYLPIKSIGGQSDTRLNDIWGWTDPETGTEYALVGRSDGLAIVDVSVPTDPVYVGTLPPHSQPSLWRDVKVYHNHAFVVSEAAGHGMQIFDLTKLRDVEAAERPVTFTASAHYDRVERAHNVVVNTDTGFAYIVGSSASCGGGLHMVNVQNPQSPTFAGCFADPSTGQAGTGYTHDAQCVTYQGPDVDYQGSEVCFNANETALNIADVTDKDSPATIANATYPKVGYVHQAWLTEDHRYLYVDDELDEQNGFVDHTRTLVFDVTNLDNPELVKSYFGPTGAIDHNQYIEGHYAYQANYESGLRVLDVAAPEEPAEVAFFDTYPSANEASFKGAWSTYPFFERNFVLVSSIGEGLFVVRPRISPILSLSANRQEQDVRLRWRISASANTDHIEVEHKGPEMTTWEQKGRVGGSTGASVQEYQYSFEALRPGTHQFRVRHISADGTVHTSAPTSVRVLPSGTYAATGPFPNPVRTQALFKVILREAQDLQIALYDVMGRRVAVLRDGLVPNGVIQRIRIRVRDRASGTYFVRVRGETFQFVRKLIVAR